VVREIVAIDLVGGPPFVDAVRRAWDDGDAVLPVDQRLPRPAREALFAAARPHRVVTEGARSVPVEAGAPPVETGTALVVATSGTTGVPKVVVHGHRSVEAHARAVHGRLGVDPGRDRWLACLPLAHLGGLGVVLRALVTGTPLDVVPGFDADLVQGAPHRLGTTLTSLVPTALDRIDPGGYRWVVLGGSADPVDRPANVVRTYGLTETGGGVVYDGRPLDGVEVRVGDGGAIALRGPVLADGLRQPDGRVEPIVDGDGWLATGDLGALGPDGRLQVEGRADELIVTGGENVWPTAVEAVLLRHPAVAEVVVVGRPDPEWGARVVAVAVAADATAPPDLMELRDHVRTELPAHAAPRQLVLVQGLPRTALGKVRRTVVAEALGSVPEWSGEPDPPGAPTGQ
jgi:O-succinylbenzoic acid--CoA ligase